MPYRLNLKQPLLTFCFDDYPLTALEAGGSILENEGCRGTFFASFGLAGRETPVGLVGEIKDLISCIHRGHELGCHTYEHLDCARLTSKELEEDCGKNLMTLKQFNQIEMKNFAFPYGKYNRRTRVAVSRLFTSGRSTINGVNYGIIDLGLLKCAPLYSRFRLDQVEALLDLAVKRCGWLIFRTHDVRHNPSPYGCTAQYFEKVLRKSLALGFDIKPIGSGIEEVKRVR